MKHYLKLIICCLFLITTCSNDYEEGSRKAILKNDPDADLIEFEDGSIYTHGIDWIEEKEFTKDEKKELLTKEWQLNYLMERLFIAQKSPVPLLLLNMKIKRKNI